MRTRYKCVVVLLIHLAFAKAINQLHAIPNNDVQTTEEILRTTINNIFNALHLNPETMEKEKIKHLTYMYNYLAGISMREHDVIREIKKSIICDKNETNDDFMNYKINLNGIISEKKNISVFRTVLGKKSVSDTLNYEYNNSSEEHEESFVDLLNEYKYIDYANSKELGINKSSKLTYFEHIKNISADNQSNEILNDVLKNFEKLIDVDKIDSNETVIMRDDFIQLYERNESSSDSDYSEFDQSLFELIADKLNVPEMIKLLENINNTRDTNKTTTYKTLIKSNHFWDPEAADDLKIDDLLQNTRRLYKKGAKLTKIRKFPFVVSVHIMSKFTCVGSIIKADLIITAASCLQIAWNNRFFRENPKFLEVRVGSDYAIAGGEMMRVLEVYFCPDYTPKTLKHNLAIMRLERYLKLGKMRGAKKIEIDRRASPLPINTDEILILGWGARTQQNMADPWRERLQYADLPYYPHHECKDVYSREYITNRLFCAGYMTRGSGACNNDVGAPGVVNGQLVGVVSFGSPICGAPDTPTVFTKVGYYSDWIEEIMYQIIPTKRLRINDTEDTTTPSKTTRVKTTTTTKNAPIFDEEEEVAIETTTEEPTAFPEENILRQFIDIMSNNNDFLNDDIQESPPHRSNEEADTRFEILDKYSDDDDRNNNENHELIDEPKHNPKVGKIKRQKNKAGHTIVNKVKLQKNKQIKQIHSDGMDEYDRNDEPIHSEVVEQQRSEVNHDYVQTEEGNHDEYSQLRSEHNEFDNYESNLDDDQYQKPVEELYNLEEDSNDAIKQFVYNDEEEREGMSVEMFENEEDEMEDFPMDYDGMDIEDVPYDFYGSI